MYHRSRDAERPSSPPLRSQDDDQCSEGSPSPILHELRMVAANLPEVHEAYREMCRLDAFLCEEDTFPCPECNSGLVVMYDTVYEQRALVSLRILGDRYFLEGQHEDSYEIFKVAVKYCSSKWGPRHPVTRCFRMKLSRTLLELGQHLRVIEELKEDVKGEGYGGGACAKLYARYAYGLSLVRLGRGEEAVGYLAQRFYGVMDTNLQCNMNVFEMTLVLALSELSRGNINFGMRVYQSLFCVMELRFKMRDCPMQFIEFCASFSYVLKRDGHEAQFQELFTKANLFNNVYRYLETNLLVNAIGCAFPYATETHQQSMKRIIVLHQALVTMAHGRDTHRLQKLHATSKFVYIWATKEQAVPILKRTYAECKEMLGSDHPLVKFCLKATKERKRGPEC